MANIKAQIDQIDNGQTLLLTDVSTWSDIANTGVTAVSILITVGTTVYTITTPTLADPCPASSLTWSIPSSQVGYSAGQPFADGMINIKISYTVSPIYTDLDANVFLDWNSKFYDFTLIKNLPYKISDNQFAYNQDIQKSMVFNTLLKGYQYSAGVGQITKANDILAIIENFKKENV